MQPATKAKLASAICQWQAKQRNTHAGAIALQALDRAEEAMQAGATLAQALYDHFNDRLLTKLEKAAGLTVTFGGGSDDLGRPQ